MKSKKRKIGFLSRISNFIYLFKRRKERLQFENRLLATRWMNNALCVAQCYRKRGWVRNQLAKHIRDIHDQYPYKIADYSEARNMYHEYPTIKGALDYNKLVERLKKGAHVYITYFRNQYPVRGERYESYFINGYLQEKSETVKLYWDEKREQIRQSYYNTDLGFHLDKDSIKICRFATKREIKTFWNRKGQYDYLQSCKEVIYNELKKINQEINAI